MKSHKNLFDLLAWDLNHTCNYGLLPFIIFQLALSVMGQHFLLRSCLICKNNRMRVVFKGDWRSLIKSEDDNW